MLRLPEIDLEALRDLAWNQPEQWSPWLRLSSLLLVAAFSFLGAWSLGTSSSEIEIAARQAAALELGREKARLARVALEATQHRAHGLQAQVQDAKREFLLSDELPELLDLLSSLCADRNVVIAALQVENQQSGGLVSAQPLSVSLGGAYHQAGLLFEDLANLPWTVVVQAFEVQSGEESSEELQLRLSLLVPVDGGA